MKRRASNDVVVTIAGDGSLQISAGICESLGLLRGEDVRVSLSDGRIVAEAAGPGAGPLNFVHWRAISHALALEERDQSE